MEESDDPVRYSNIKNLLTMLMATQIFVAGKPSLNPEYSAWLAADRRTTIILNASLTEEAVAKTIGSNTARQIWL